MDERRFDVFLSYNSADRPLVERIAERLREERLHAWWDRWALTPGSSWQEEIVEGLRASRSCAVIVGPKGLGSWAREELAVAQDLAATERHFRIFMVLLPDAPELSDPGLAFLRSRTWVDLRKGLDHDGVEDLVSAITGIPRRRDGAVKSTDICPYRGLDAFDEEHAEYFFGREDDVALVVEKLKSSRFLAVLGPSGSGKSSLLRAGLVPALRRGALSGSEVWPLRVFRPGSRPATNLAVQMTHLLSNAPIQDTLDRLRQDERSLDLAASVALAARSEGDRVVLIVDQFEELFTSCRAEDERMAFLTNLLYAATIPGGRVVVVMGMRADFYHRCAAYRDLRVLISDQQFLVGSLDAEGLRRAIEEPARRVGLELEAGLVETMSTDVGAHPGALPLLEHALVEVWERRRGGMLTLEGYVASGGVDGALAQRANATYTALSPIQQEIARRVLLRLVQPGEAVEDTRRRAEMGELVTRPEEQHEVESVVGALADRRLVTTGRDEFSGAAVVDIAHESLIRAWPELRTWINEDREALRAQRHLTQAASEWDQSGREGADLYSGSRLAYWKERGWRDLSALERDFISASLKHETQERGAGRRRIRLAVGGSMLSVSVIAVVTLIGLRSVSNQRDVARSRQFAAESAAALLVNPSHSRELAVRAFDAKSTEEAELALRRAVSTPGSRVTVLRGHEGGATSATLSPDGDRVLSTGQDSTVRVWDRVAEKELRSFRGHAVGDEPPVVYSAAFSPDGTRVASAGSDHMVRIWDAFTGDEVAVLRHEGHVTSIAFSRDGARLVSAGGGDGTVRIWDSSTGSQLALLEGHESVLQAGFSPSGQSVITAGADSTVHIWDWATGRELYVNRQHEGADRAAISPDGQWIVSAGSRSDTIWVWPVAGGDPVALKGAAGGVHSAAFSPDSTKLVSAGIDGTVRIWAVRERRELAVLRGHADAVKTAVFGADGSQLVSAGVDGTVRVWDWAAGGEPVALPGHQGAVVAAFSPDAKHVVSAGLDDGTVRVWDWVTRRELSVLRVGEQAEASFTPDGRVLVEGGDETGARVWDWAQTGKVTVLPGQDGIYGAAFSPDGMRVAGSGNDSGGRVWDRTGTRQLVSLQTEGDSSNWSLSDLTFSPDGSRIVGEAYDEINQRWSVRMWDALTGREVAAFRSVTLEHYVSQLVFSPDGKLLAGPQPDGTLSLWDSATGREIAIVRGHERFMDRVFFTADSGRLIGVGRDGTGRLWYSRTGREIALLRIPGLNAVSTDGVLALGTGREGTIRVWKCSPCGPTPTVLTLARLKVLR